MATARSDRPALLGRIAPLPHGRRPSLAATLGALGLALALVGCNPAGTAPAFGGIDRRRCADRGRVAGSDHRARTIKIGYVSPRPARSPPFAEADGYIISGITEAIAAGIVSNGTTYPIRDHQKDSQSDPNRAPPRSPTSSSSMTRWT
jgi:branched-chain amino acid transport system substrate-binding protein